MKTFLSVLFCALALLAFAAPARAETPDYAYVGLTCDGDDAKGFDAAILFTLRVVRYQDGGTLDRSSAPVFPLLPAAIDHGISTGIVIVPGAENDQANCGNIAVRHGASPWQNDETHDWISVWVGERKILSRFPISYDGDPFKTQTHDDALLIVGGKVSICRHGAASAKDCKPLGDVSSMGVIQNWVDNERLAPGRIAATFASDRKLCDSLIKGGAKPGDAGLAYINKPDNRDSSYYLQPQDQDAISFRDAQPIKGTSYDFHRKDGEYFPMVETAVYDLANNGKPQLVINVESENHYMTGNYLASFPATKPSLDIIKTAIGLMDDLDAPTFRGLLFQKGWRLFSGENTQYRAGRYSQITPGRVNGVTYILVTSDGTGFRAKNDHSIAVLMKPQPDGTMTKVCEYHRGEPVF